MKFQINNYVSNKLTVLSNNMRYNKFNHFNYLNAMKSLIFNRPNNKIMIHESPTIKNVIYFCRLF